MSTQPEKVNFPPAPNNHSFGFKPDNLPVVNENEPIAGNIATGVADLLKVANNVCFPDVVNSSTLAVPMRGFEPPLKATLPPDPNCNPIEPAQAGAPKIANAKHTANIFRARVILVLHTDLSKARERSRNARNTL
jgi:hypothetical protein